MLLGCDRGPNGGLQAGREQEQNQQELGEAKVNRLCPAGSKLVSRGHNRKRVMEISPWDQSQKYPTGPAYREIFGPPTRIGQSLAMNGSHGTMFKKRSRGGAETQRRREKKFIGKTIRVGAVYSPYVVTYHFWMRAGDGAPLQGLIVLAAIPGALPRAAMNRPVGAGTTNLNLSFTRY